MAETPDRDDQSDDQPEREVREDGTFGDEYPSDRPTAEESAVHTFDESLGGFDSEVDDQALEDAWELDPEVER